MRVHRIASVTAATVGMFVLGSGVAFAHECVNISKPAGAGIQVLIDVQTDEIVWATQGVHKRIANGTINPDTGEGFHGLLGLDFDGDGHADAATYIVTPTGEIPQKAQWNGAQCRGIVNFAALETCATTPL